MYLLKTSFKPNPEMSTVTLVDTLEEVKQRYCDDDSFKTTVYECIDVTDLVLQEEDKSKFDVQTFIRYGSFGLKPETKEKMGEINYARWIMNQYDVPATVDFDTRQYRNNLPLYCTYEGERYKYVGHSRLGDVWITKDFSSEHYEKRVSILDLSYFSDKP